MGAARALFRGKKLNSKNWGGGDIEEFELYLPVPDTRNRITSFMGTALSPQGLWEQEIGSLLAVPTNLWEQLFPQRLWEHQMGVSHWLFPQICRNGILCLILQGGGPKSLNRKIPNGRIFLFTDFCPPPSVEICAKVAVNLFHVTKTNTK